METIKIYKELPNDTPASIKTYPFLKKSMI